MIVQAGDHNVQMFQFLQMGHTHLERLTQARCLQRQVFQAIETTVVQKTSKIGRRGKEYSKDILTCHHLNLSPFQAATRRSNMTGPMDFDLQRIE